MVSKKYGTERIHYTGMPKLDDLYAVKKSNKGMPIYITDIYKGSFYLVNEPTDIISKDIYDAYTTGIVSVADMKLIYKVHPGRTVEDITLELPAEFKDITIIQDDPYDRFNTYEWIKASSAVIAIESFFLVDATLMNKPIIMWGKESIPMDWWKSRQNIMQSERLSDGLSSAFGNLVFTDKQRELQDQYLCDGHNTERVVKFLEEL